MLPYSITDVDPIVIKSNITESEDKVICELQALYGNQWATIAKYLPGRCMSMWMFSVENFRSLLLFVVVVVFL